METDEKEPRDENTPAEPSAVVRIRERIHLLVFVMWSH